MVIPCHTASGGLFMSGLSLSETNLDPAVTVHADEPVPSETGQRRHVWVTCKCGEKRLASFPTGKEERAKWTGLCRSCAQVKELPDGLKARRDSQNPSWGWVTCPVGGPDCEGERYIRLADLDATRRCVPCYGLSRRTLTGTRRHKSGAIIDYDRPDPDSKRKRFMFTCANPDNNPGCLKEAYGYTTDFLNEDWRGRCPTCVDYRADVTLANGTRIGYSEENERGEVPIYFSLCKHDRWVTRKRAPSLYTVLGVICRTCFENPAALAQRLAELAASGTPAPTKPEGKRGRKSSITEANVRAAFKALGALALQDEVAEYVGVEPRTFRDWLKNKKLTYRQCQQRFGESGGNSD